MPKIKELIQPPPEPEGDGEQQLAALRDYLVKITQELYYLLTHLEADNINDSTFQKISEMIPRPYVGQPRMDGEASAGQSGQWARGDHRHGSDTSKADVTALEATAEDLAETAEDLAEHVADKDNPHEVTKAQVGLGSVANERQYSAQNPPPIPTPGEVGAVPVTREINGHALSADVTLDHTDVGAIPAAAKGSAGGVAELDSNGMVPSAQLPSYVDDVLEYASLASFPVTGESGKIYVALDTNRTYRWSGSAYIEISESLALGETSSTAYRGDRGKTAYDHSQTTGNPHETTAAQVGARPDTWMPTASDVGAYVLPSGGIPKTDLASGVQTSLDLADSALQSVPNTYRTAAAQDAIDAGKQAKITASGILKGDGAGGVSAATAGTDYQEPLTAGTDYATPTQLAGKAPFSAGIFPGTSSTAGGTQAKVGTVPDLSGLTALYDGLTICMTFANAQTYDGQPTLDIGIPYAGVTAFGINRTAASAAGIYDWGTGSAVDLVFDATAAVWVMKKGQHGSAVRYGVLLLSDSVSENSTVGGGKAATPAAVKAAYDLAAGKTATDVSYDTATHKIKKTVDGVTSVVATADTTPTANSDNLVTSGGVKAEIDTALADVLQQEILLVQISAVTSLPVTVTDDLITVDHVVLEAELGDPQAQTSEWTATTAAGSVTISGSISGTTSLKLILGKLNNPPE